MKTTRSPLRAIRRHCLDCAEGNAKYVLWCTQDGLHSSRCPLWPYRLGVRPATAHAKFPALVTPELMPPASANLEALPDGLQSASTHLDPSFLPPAKRRNPFLAVAHIAEENPGVPNCNHGSQAGGFVDLPGGASVAEV
jgi:hypothetical protein